MPVLDDIFSHGIYKENGHADVLLMPEQPEAPEQPQPEPPQQMKKVRQITRNLEGLIVRTREWDCPRDVDQDQYAKTHDVVVAVKEIKRDKDGLILDVEEYTLTEKATG